MTPLRKRFIEDMQLRGLAPTTQRSYIHYVAEFARFYDASPEKLDLEAIRQYEIHLLNERKLSPESVNTFVSSVQFLYTVTLELPWEKQCFPRVRVPSRLPVVLDPEEVAEFFDYVPSLKYRAALMLCYGAGLRIAEAVAIKVSDIDSRRMLMRVEQGKGGKDRYVMLSPRLLAVLRRYYRAARPNRLPPYDWMFPSWRESRHLCAHSLSDACRRVPAMRARQAHHRPYAAPFVCHAPVGERHRLARDSGAAGPYSHRHHGALYQGRRPRHCPHSEPARRAGPAPTEAPEITPDATAHARSGRHCSTARQRLPGSSDAPTPAVACPARHRGLPHGGPRWPPRRMRPLLTHPSRLQLLPQPPLPQVSKRRAGPMAGSPKGRPVAGGILPRRFYAASTDCRHRLLQPGGGLQHPVPRHRRDPAQHCRRQPASRRRYRLLRHPAHLGTEPAVSSSSALRRSRRRSFPGSRALDRLPSGLLSPCARALASVPAPIPRSARGSVPTGRTPVLRRSGTAPRNRRLPRLPGSPARRRMGGLCQTALRRPTTGHRVPRPLYAPGRHLQSTPGLPPRRPGLFPLERLPPQT